MFDVLTNSVLITCLWLASYTVLFPLILLITYNRTVREWWFCIFYFVVFKCLFTTAIYQTRKKTFDILKKDISKRKSSAPLEVLEIGIAYGLNLQFYPENVNLTGLDVNRAFETFIQRNGSKYPNINYVKTYIGRAEDMSQIEDNTFDAVVGTYVLCSVTNVKSVVNEVRRVLKPGGRYLFMEHIAYPKNNKKGFFQSYIKHLWKIYFAGCNIDRNPKKIIEDAEFSNVDCKEEFQHKYPLVCQPHLLGIATK